MVKRWQVLWENAKLLHGAHYINARCTLCGKFLEYQVPHNAVRWHKPAAWCPTCSHLWRHKAHKWAILKYAQVVRPLSIARLAWGLRKH